MKTEAAFDHIAAFAWVAALSFVVIAHVESGEKAKGRDVASIEYLRVYRLACFPENAGFKDQEVDFRIESTLAYVTAENISLFIDEKAGRAPIAISPNGWFTLPYSKEMLAGNPESVSNQPTGSLSLECIVSQKCIMLPRSRAVTYRRLVEPELLSRSIEAVIDAKKACPLPEVLSFRLDRPGVGNVAIQAVKKIEAIPVRRGSGLFQIPLSPGLMEENPLVVFPAASRCVYMVEDCGMPMPRVSGRVLRF